MKRQKPLKGYISQYAYAKKHNANQATVYYRVQKGLIPTNKHGDIKENEPYVDHFISGPKRK